MLWFILTLMTCVAALWVAAPFLQAAPASDDGHNPDANVYRDQLAEVDREQRDNLISPEQADSARLEIKRRLLALDRSALPVIRRLSSIERTFFGRGLALAGVVAAMALYLMNGNPEIPAQSRSATATPATATVAARAVPPSASGAPVGAPVAAGAPSIAGVDEMIEKLAARLAKSPNDADGWRMLGWSYFGTERFAEAGQAYAKAIELSPQVGSLRTSLGEALVRAADGRVAPDAVKAFDDAIKLDAKDPRARFFLGLAKEQVGNKAAALKDWLAVLSDASPTDDWLPDLKERVQTLAKELGQDVSAAVSKTAAAAPQTPTSSGGQAAAAQVPAAGGVLGKLNAAAQAEQTAVSGRGPTPADIKAAEALPASDRNAMIQSMVDGLQKRLDAAPRDAEGWTKLMRSRMVLGDAAKAKTALDRALKTFADSPNELKLITDTATELGINR
jgi:cytochrome c-type biogenesis protein CcmH